MLDSFTSIDSYRDFITKQSLFEGYVKFCKNVPGTCFEVTKATEVARNTVFVLLRAFNEDLFQQCAAYGVAHYLHYEKGQLKLAVEVQSKFPSASCDARTAISNFSTQ